MGFLFGVVLMGLCVMLFVVLLMGFFVVLMLFYTLVLARVTTVNTFL